MLNIMIVLLTAVLIFNCALLILLVLIQLPKKDAGAGLAFGSGTTDALFGAGSGNALTKITKYATATFFALSVILSVMTMRASHGSDSEFMKRTREQEKVPAGMTAPPAAGTSAGAQTPAAVPADTASGAGKLSILSSSNAPAPATSTNK